MENNKLLIGVQFTYSVTPSSRKAGDSAPTARHHTLELYVLRDITLQQLMDGIEYGLRKRVDSSPMYQKCYDIFKTCASEVSNEGERPYFSQIRLGFCHQQTAEAAVNDKGEKLTFQRNKQLYLYRDSCSQPLYKLGFINSSRLIFSEVSEIGFKGSVDTSNLVEAFAPVSDDKQNSTVKIGRKITFPEYNISTRLLYRFDETPVEIIPPQEPPKKPEQSLFTLLLPSLLTLLVMLVGRTFIMGMFSGNAMSGLQMALFSGLMSAIAVVTTTLTWRRQQREYRINLANWRVRYEDYINRLMKEIRGRQRRDAQKLKELYPDVTELVQPAHKTDTEGNASVYSLNSNVYSRAPQDEDFLTFRVGLSDDVESRFPIKGEEKDAVFSEAYFVITPTDKKPGSEDDALQLYLGSENIPDWEAAMNLSRLTGVISKRFRFMDNAPLLYSLRKAGAVGLVDKEAGSPSEEPCAANYFVTRMIFELCCYHSPENLQFIIFFPRETSEGNIERLIFPYKFMPHFRELFPDRSQFVFDDQSARLILSGLLNLMDRRQSAGDETTPHVVLIVYDEYSLREHAFAEFLPKAPEPGKEFENKLGLTFVYVTNYREYLPHYCDSVFSFERRYSKETRKWRDFMTVTPRRNLTETQEFRCSSWSEARNQGTRPLFELWRREMNRSAQAFQFLSAVYYTRIAENGKVPSVVTLYELLPGEGAHLEDAIRQNWGLSGERGNADITKSLRVPVGRTDTDTAYLDLHEKADGPHMLVAGTTGSGKTETIITYLLELCALFRPDELNLLLVDMKGGGFTKRIGQLPHVVGAVTDVDGDENGTGAEYMLHRFLDAMRSEIKRRKILFNQMHVDNIDDYIKACRDIEKYLSDKKELSPDEVETVRKTADESPLSHIMLVVDEFTELKQFTRENDELDFMGEITKIARIGRSLGFHILLISQNIEGAITDDIRVNSNARLCLKVATRQASREMIGTDVACSPSMPGHGRAYLKALTRESLTYFQSGYSAASASMDEEFPFEITLASKCGAYQSFYRSQDKKAEEELKGLKKSDKNTQLSMVVNAIRKVNQEWKKTSSGDAEIPFRIAHTVFHPPLPNRVLFKSGDILDLSRKDGEAVKLTRESDGQNHALELPMGLYDAPLDQKQPVFYLDLLHCNTAVFGVAMSGKTTFIKTLLLRLHENCDSRPEENIYILDFGGNLGAYNELPNVRACFDSSNEEDIKRVFHEIERRMEENADFLGSQNYGSKLKDNPAECPPHLTLIIENLNAFLSNERYAPYQERLLQFCRDGQSKGLSVVFTASDTAGTGKFSTAFQKKVALEMPSDSYYDIFGRKVTPPMRLPGRGIVTLESQEYEFQCFDPFRAEKASERRDEESALLESLSSCADAASNEKRLKAFGKVLTPQECERVAGSLVSGEKICVGLDYERHMPVCLDIQESRAIAIYGKRHFGKTNLLRLLLDGILKAHPDARFVLLDGGKGQLTKEHLPEFYAACSNPRYFINDLDKFWDYLGDAGYLREEYRRGGAKQELNKANLFSAPSVTKSAPSALSPAPEWKDEAKSAPFTVFVLQCRKLYQNSKPAQFLMGRWIPEAIGDAEDKNYLFLFTDVKPIITDPEINATFRNNVSAAFLLDNIGEFALDKGNKSVFGEMDAKELKSKYARCSLGDGYFYDMEDETKLKFIHYGASD